MEPSRIALFLKRTAVGGAVLAVSGVLGWMWHLSNVLDRNLLIPETSPTEPDHQIVAIGGGRVLLTKSSTSQREGVWGLVGPDGYGQVAAIVEIADEHVERSFRTLDGSLGPGDLVRFDEFAFTGDPESALGLSFEDVRIPSELGVLQSWFIDNDRDTWIVVVHDKDPGQLRQSLRILPLLHNQGFPVLVTSYRNAAGAPTSQSGRYGWGLHEWTDVEAALDFAQSQGAEDFVVVGYGMGASIIVNFLHESERVTRVLGAVFDSAILDLAAVVDDGAPGKDVPAILAGSVKRIVSLRFGIDWERLDQVDRADSFDVPVLLMHGSEDAIAPVWVSDAFAAARPDLVRYERFDGAGHTMLWNTNPPRYETVLLGFLIEVAGTE